MYCNSPIIRKDRVLDNFGDMQLNNRSHSFSLREKARMRGYTKQKIIYFNPLTPTLSLRERELTELL